MLVLIFRLLAVAAMLLTVLVIFGSISQSI